MTDDLKWYSTFFFLLGAILGFADPVTDWLNSTKNYTGDGFSGE